MGLAAYEVLNRKLIKLAEERGVIGRLASLLSRLVEKLIGKLSQLTTHQLLTLGLVAWVVTPKLASISMTVVKATMLRVMIYVVNRLAVLLNRTQMKLTLVTDNLITRRLWLLHRVSAPVLTVLAHTWRTARESNSGGAASGAEDPELDGYVIRNLC